MIGLIIKFLPYVFTIYFLIRFMKEPVYLLGIPFVIFLRHAIFVDQAYIFIQPGTWNTELKFLGWLFFVWIAISLKSHFNTNKDGKYNKLELNYQDYLIFALIGITSIGLLLTINEYYQIDDVYTQYFTLLSLALGYFMIKDIFRFTNPKLFAEFLFSIVIINSIASFFYIMHQGLHIHFYDVRSEYLSLNFEGGLITRTFWFMPALWFFSISHLLVFRRNKSLVNIILLTINILGVFISYTKSFLIIAIFTFILYFLLTGLKKGNIFDSVKSLIFVCAAGILLFFALSTLLPSSTNYFLSRFKELDEQPARGAKYNNNLEYRFYKTENVINRMDQEKVLFGHGSVTEKQMPFIKIVNIATADMAWAEVVFRWGYFGLAIFALLFTTAFVYAFLIYMRTEGILSQLALLFLLIIISQLIESFTSSTFMSPNRFPMGLWYFGVFSAIISSYQKQKNSKLAI